MVTAFNNKLNLSMATDGDLRRIRGILEANAFKVGGRPDIERTMTELVQKRPFKGWADLQKRVYGIGESMVEVSPLPQTPR